MKKRTKENWLIAILLIFIIFLNFLPKIERVGEYDQILASDPYAHLSLEKQILIEERYPKNIFWDLGGGVVGSLPLFHINNVVSSLITKLDLHSLIKYGGPILSILYIILFFIFARKITDLKSAIISTLLFSSIHLIIGRTILSLPENLSFIFFLTSLILLKRRENSCLFLSLFFGFSSILTHSFGYIYSFFLLGYILIFRIKMSRKNIILILLALILLFGIIGYSVSVSKSLLYGSFDLIKNIRLNGNFLNIFKEVSLLIGETTLLFSLLGIIYVYSKDRIKKDYLLSYILLFFLVLVGFLYAVSWPSTLRFYSYMAIPLCILAGISFNILDGKIFILSIILILCIILIPFSYDYGWNELYGEGFVNASHTINGLKRDNTTIVTSLDSYRYLTANLDGINYKIYTGNNNSEIMEENPRIFIQWMKDNSNYNTYIFYQKKLNPADKLNESKQEGLILRTNNMNYLEKEKIISNIYENEEIIIFKVNNEYLNGSY